MKIWEGGLASHGAAIGILTAIYLYARKMKGQSFLWVVDRVVIVVALTGCLIRFGNFMNSEIIGKPTGTDSGVVFARYATDYLESNRAIEKVNARKGEASNDSETPVVLEVQFEDSDFQEEGLSNYISGQLKSDLGRIEGISKHLTVPDGNDFFTLQKPNRSGYKADINLSGVARHPAQLYESISSLLLFLVLFYVWFRKKENTQEV